MLTFVTKREHPNVKGIRIVDSIDEVIQLLSSSTEICIDIETTSLDPLTAQIYLMGAES